MSQICDNRFNGFARRKIFLPHICREKLQSKLPTIVRPGKPLKRFSKKSWTSCHRAEAAVRIRRERQGNFTRSLCGALDQLMLLDSTLVARKKNTDATHQCASVFFCELTSTWKEVGIFSTSSQPNATYQDQSNL